MKNFIYSNFGHPKEVLKLQDGEKPTPKDNQILIKVKGSSLSLYDYQRFIEPIKGEEVSKTTRYMDSEFSNLLGKTLGIDIAGVVEAVGKEVTSVKVGDEVFAVGDNLIGAWAEYALANDGEVGLKPTNLSFEEAGAVPSTAITALGALRLANLQKGQHILIIGATGGVGQFAVQLAKELGLTVTGVCSTRNKKMVRNLGADYVIDYNKENLVECTQKFDAILGISGYQTLEEYKALLNSNGVYIPLKTELLLEAQKQGETVFNGDKKIEVFYYPMKTDKEMPYLKELIESGKVSVVVDKTYSIKNLVDAIVDCVENHPQGKVLLTVDF